MEVRTKAFAKNMELEEALFEINSLLGKAEQELLKENIEEQPIIFIMGAPRSGTTLTFQWLAESDKFSYPTNFISRFYNAPITAAKIQNIMVDPKLQFRDEFSDIRKNIDFISANGKTKGVLSPNEFWYFWKRYLPDNKMDYVEDERLLKEMNYIEFAKELWGMAAVMGKPLVLKGLICNYNIPFLNQVFKKAIFIHVRRVPEENMEAIFEARKRQFGTGNIWYSTKIREYEELMRYDDPMEQIAGQVYCINRAIEEGLKSLPDEKKLTIHYEEFCENPNALFAQIAEKAKIQNWDFDFSTLRTNTKFKVHHRKENLESNKEKYEKYKKLKEKS